jgi:hypothetical protein
MLIEIPQRSHLFESNITDESVYHLVKAFKLSNINVFFKLLALM